MEYLISTALIFIFVPTLLWFAFCPLSIRSFPPLSSISLSGPLRRSFAAGKKLNLKCFYRFYCVPFWHINSLILHWKLLMKATKKSYLLFFIPFYPERDQLFHFHFVVCANQYRPFKSIPSSQIPRIRLCIERNAIVLSIQTHIIDWVALKAVHKKVDFSKLHQCRLGFALWRMNMMINEWHCPSLGVSLCIRSQIESTCKHFRPIWCFLYEKSSISWTFHTSKFFNGKLIHFGSINQHSSKNIKISNNNIINSAGINSYVFCMFFSHDECWMEIAQSIYWK